MEEKNPRVQRGSDRARTENRSGGSPRRGEKAPRANGNENGQGNKKTRTYKHVQLEHKRPQLSKAGEGRSEERRVGKECLRLCRSRWSPYH